jgi:DNA-binding MarR family transcriptional regulator
MSSDGAPEQGKEREAAAGDAWHALYGFVFEREGQSRFHEACDAIGLAPGGLKTLPMRDLAEYFRCDPSYVTSLVDGLESAGFAERRTHATDRRVKMVVLSHSGVEAQAQVRKILGQPPASFSALTTPELVRLRSLLAKLDPPERPPAG